MNCVWECRQTEGVRDSSRARNDSWRTPWVASNGAANSVLVDIQDRIESAELSPTVAYELSKLESEDQQRAAIAQEQSQPLTVALASSSVRQRRGISAPKTRGLKQVFLTEEGLKVTVTASRKATYNEIPQALQVALEEVQTRIRSGLQLF